MESKKAIRIVQANVKEQVDQLSNLAQFSSNILLKFGTEGADKIPNMTEAMTGDLSSLLNDALVTAINAGDVNVNADADASNSIATFVHDQLYDPDKGILAAVYQGIIDAGQQEEYGIYSALLPYFKSAGIDINTAITDFGIDTSTAAGKAMSDALTAIDSNIIASSVDGLISDAIIGIVKSGDSQKAADLADSLSNFSINTASLMELEAVKETFNELGGDIEGVPALVEELDNKIANLGYTTEEVASSFTKYQNKVKRIK